MKINFQFFLRFLFFLLIFLALVNISFSQKISFSNLLKYGTGKENPGSLETDKRKEYFDNMADIRAFYDDFTIGFRFDIDKPPEYGLPFNGIKKRFVEFQKDGIDIRAGNIYTLFSRGLTLNLFENKNLGFDNGLDGIKIHFENKLLSATLLGGEIEFKDPNTINNIEPYSENYSLRGANIEFRFPLNFFLGTNYIWTEAKTKNEITKIDESSIYQIPELFFKYKSKEIDLFFSYAIKRSKINDVDSTSGSGFYASLSNISSIYGITFEYKDYRFDITDPLKRQEIHRKTRFLPIQNPPIVHKEHSSTLLSRYYHVVDFNDEVGFQIDANFMPKPELIFNINYSMSSRHNAYDIFYNNGLTARKLNNGDAFLPKIDNKFSPFWEFYADFEYYFNSPSSYLKAGMNRRSEIAFDEVGEFFEIKSSHPLKSFTIPILLQHSLSDTWAFKLNVESQWVTKSKYPEDNNFFNQLISAQLTHSPDFSFSITFEVTNNEDEVSGQKTWLSGEFSYKLSQHFISFSYGSERGGQICSNGICRIVYPFKGFRLSILSNL